MKNCNQLIITNVFPFFSGDWFLVEIDTDLNMELNLGTIWESLETNDKWTLSGIIFGSVVQDENLKRMKLHCKLKAEGNNLNCKPQEGTYFLLEKDQGIPPRE